jgi:hypothetical protein
MNNSSYLSVFEYEIECSGTSAYKIQTPGNYLEERIQQKVFCFI